MPLSGSHVISGRRKERANALLGLGTLAGALALAARGAFTAGVSGSEREIGVSLYYYFKGVVVTKQVPINTNLSHYYFFFVYTRAP